MRRVLGSGRLIAATIAIGVLAGIGATGFHFLADRFGEVLFAWVESQTAASRLPFVLLVPTVGLGLRDLAAISAAAGIAFLASTAILGDAFPFALSTAPLAVPLSGLLLVAPLMGLAAAPTGHLFIRMLGKFRTLFPARWPLAARVALG